jgi:hypothetical protein
MDGEGGRPQWHWPLVVVWCCAGMSRPPHGHRLLCGQAPVLAALHFWGESMEVEGRVCWEDARGEGGMWVPMCCMMGAWRSGAGAASCHLQMVVRAAAGAFCMHGATSGPSLHHPTLVGPKTQGGLTVAVTDGGWVWAGGSHICYVGGGRLGAGWGPPVCASGRVCVLDNPCVCHQVSPGCVLPRAALPGMLPACCCRCCVASSCCIHPPTLGQALACVPCKRAPLVSGRGPGACPCIHISSRLAEVDRLHAPHVARALHGGLVGDG